MNRLIKQSLTALLLFALVFSFSYAEEATKKLSVSETVKLIVSAPTAEKRYEFSHILAEFSAKEISKGLDDLPENVSPKAMVALLSVSLPKGVITGFHSMFEKVLQSPDSQAKIAMFDLVGYSVSFSLIGDALPFLAKNRVMNLSSVETIHYWRSFWMLFTFFGNQYMISKDDFAVPKHFQKYVTNFYENPNYSERVRGEAAVTLGEMGKTSDELLAFIKRFANDPTSLGRRARSVLMGHPIYDEVLKRSLLMHPDVEKIAIKKFAMEAAKGLANALDKHSTFFDEEGVKSWGESMNGEYGGIGAYVSAKDGIFTITRPFYNGPAYKVGLRSGDRIVEVNGEVMTGGDLEMLVSRLKGMPGTEVTIKIYRKGWTAPRDFTLIRGKIVVPNIYTAKLPGNIAYLRLGSFSTKAKGQMVDALRKISSWEPDGLIFDLRGNPGGLLQAAVDVVSMFCGGNKLVVYEQGRPEIYQRQNHYSSNNFKTFTKPLVVLINENSASASEIVSGTLQFYERATLIGETSYGKGSVQIPFFVANSDFTCKFKVTIAKYFLANDKCIHGIGIKPHIEVKNPVVQGYVIDELARLRETGALGSYINNLVATDKELAISLAENDFGEYKRYPGIEAWAGNLDTFLKMDMIRYVVNDELRRVVQDIIGKEFSCNPGVDVQLQEGILTALRLSKKEPEKMSEVLPFVVAEQKRLAELKEAEAKKKKMYGDKEEKPEPVK